MSNIHNYPLTATQINDEDFYDVDYWNGVAYESRKISGADLKAAISGVEELNDLLDVETALPVSPTNADDGRVLYFDIDTGKWISDDIANIANVVKDCKTTTGNTIPKGTPVALTGFDNDLLVVEPADASNPALMPAIGVTAETLDDTNAKKVVSFGKLQGVDTSAFANGDELFVAAGGGFTITRPTGTAEIQRVATVLKSDNPGGLLKVFNTSRTAGLPNIQQGNIWLGDADGYPQEEPLCPVLLSDLQETDIVAICRWNGSSFDRFGVVGSDFTQNIYNADGQLTGNRIVDIDAFNLAFQIGGFTILRMLNGAQPEVVIGGAGTPSNYGILEVNGISTHYGVRTTNQNGFWLQLLESVYRLDLNGTLTANRNQTFQDKDGTIALLSDITGNAEKMIGQHYAYDMSPAAAYTWNGLTIGATAITTYNDSYRAQEFVGTGQPDGCLVNSSAPLFYPANADINVVCLFSSDGTGGTYRMFVGLQQPNAGSFGNDSTTIWQDVILTATAGFGIEKVQFTFTGLTILPGEPIAVKVYRDPGDASDTYGGLSYLNNILIEIK